MDLIEIENSHLLIPISMFDICLVDKISRAEIAKKYIKGEVTKNKSCYFLQKFNHHLITNFNLDIKEYVIKYLEVVWPKCPINGKEVGFSISGKGLELSKYNTTVNKEHSEKFRQSCEKMSEDRRGEGNPMFGREPWNLGLTAEDDPRMKSISEKGIGRKASPETILKQQEAYKKSFLKNPKPRHCTPHSEETKEFLRENTARLWAEGVFNRVTSIHIATRKFLDTLKLKEKYEEEYQVKYYSIDFAFPKLKIALEVQGTYYHIDPRVYPNGPINAMQRRNFGRDVAKRKFLEKLGWTLIEVWEIEINDGTFKEQLLCKLKELNLLEESDKNQV